MCNTYSTIPSLRRKSNVRKQVCSWWWVGQLVTLGLRNQKEIGDLVSPVSTDCSQTCMMGPSRAVEFRFGWFTIFLLHIFPTAWTFWYFVCIFRKIQIGDFWQFIFALWLNQISYSKSTTIWRKLKFSAFSRWLWIFCCTFGLHVAIKTISPSVANFYFSWFLQIFKILFWSKITKFDFPKDNFFGTPCNWQKIKK